ncbi:hypothetical protein LUX32_04990 [Actinomadura madurae]|nr:hypothetical protein [Actinomadura madurae]MCP9977076.1 hypothetical protein [Actinomadura madurae]
MRVAPIRFPVSTSPTILMSAGGPAVTTRVVSPTASLPFSAVLASITTSFGPCGARPDFRS